jgi:hypothetical protein
VKKKRLCERPFFLAKNKVKERTKNTKKNDIDRQKHTTTGQRPVVQFLFHTRAKMAFI